MSQGQGEVLYRTEKIKLKHGEKNKMVLNSFKIKRLDKLNITYEELRE